MPTPASWIPTGTSRWDPPWFTSYSTPSVPTFHIHGCNVQQYTMEPLHPGTDDNSSSLVPGTVAVGVRPQGPATLHACCNRTGACHIGSQTVLHRAIHPLHNPPPPPYRAVAFCIRLCHGLGSGHIGRERGMPRGSSRQRWRQRGLQGIGAWTTSPSTTIGSRLNGRDMCVCDRAATRGRCRTPPPHPCMLHVRTTGM